MSLSSPESLEVKSDGLIRVLETSSYVAGCIATKIPIEFDVDQLKDGFIVGMQKAMKETFCRSHHTTNSFSGKY